MEQTFSMNYMLIEGIQQLSREDTLLFEAADEIMLTAYAPYSGFSVGAALLLDNGQIVSGANQENASYPLCMCAERVALYSAISQFPESRGIKMAVVANSSIRKTDRPIPPCGACRQVLLEFEYRFEHPIEILLRDDYGKFYRFPSVRQLLPFAFDGSFLKSKG